MDWFVRIILTLSAIGVGWLGFVAGSDLAVRLGLGELTILFQATSVAAAVGAFEWLLDRSGLFAADPDH